MVSLHRGFHFFRLHSLSPCGIVCVSASPSRARGLWPDGSGAVSEEGGAAFFMAVDDLLTMSGARNGASLVHRGVDAFLLRLSALSKPTFLKARRGLVATFAIQYVSGNPRTHTASTYHISQEFLSALAEPQVLKDKYFCGGSVVTQGPARLGSDVT